MTAWSTPLDMVSAVMANIQQDPQANQVMIGVGPAMDVVKNAPINLFFNGPHYEFEANQSVRSNLPGTAN